MSSSSSSAEAEVLLAALCDELASAVVASPTTVSHAQRDVDNLIEGTFSRLDDITALVDSAEDNVRQTTEVTLPDLVANAKNLESVYRIIDDIEDFVRSAYNSAQAFASRATDLEKAHAAKNPKTMTRVIRSLSFAKSSSSKSVPDWDPEPHLFNTTKVFDGIRSRASAADVASAEGLLPAGESGTASTAGPSEVEGGD